MRYKSWPYYKDWCEIFGKDRATGENAEGFADALHDVLSGGQDNRGTAPRAECPQTPNPIDENDHTSTYNPQTSARSSDKSKKKRKQKNQTDARLADLAKRIGFEQDASSSRKAIYDAPDKMTFLIVETKIAVATQLSNKTNELDIFFALTDENKAVFVKLLLEGKI
ncbi:hypothetical protein DH2020_046872 [Rehmannia glutinosa]|uniref:Uncharacterized protein n=1 Tax=Rehmannia glutinosa TaxID=99300 RepID=A0ABR0UAJ8_REHGL